MPNTPKYFGLARAIAAAVVLLIACAPSPGFSAKRIYKIGTGPGGSPPQPWLAPPSPSDSCFVLSANDEDNTDLDVVSVCENVCFPNVFTYILKIDRVVPDIATLQSHGLIQVRLRIGAYGVDNNCFEASDGFPCPKMRVVINGNEITDHGGLMQGQEGRWSESTFEIPASDIHFGEQEVAAVKAGSRTFSGSPGVNTIQITYDADFVSSNRQLMHRPFVHYLAVDVKAPLPVLLVPGNGNTAPFSFGPWKATFHDNGIPFNEELLLGYAGEFETDASLIATAIGHLKDTYHVKKVNVLAYSKGGIDIREYLAREEQDDVAHITTLSAPNLGVPLTDYFLGLPKIAQELLKLVLDDALMAVRIGNGTLQLTQLGMMEYNKTWKPLAKVPFLTVAARHDQYPDAIHQWKENASVQITQNNTIYGTGPSGPYSINDGVVFVASAHGVPEIVPHEVGPTFYVPGPSLDSYHTEVDNALGLPAVVGVENVAPHAEIGRPQEVTDATPVQLVATETGVVASGAIASGSFALEADKPATLFCSGGPGLRYQLFTPSGDSLFAFADSGGANGFVREDGDPFGGQGVTFGLLTPEAGTWSVRIADSLAVPDSGFVGYNVVVFQASDAGPITAHTAAKVYAAGSNMLLLAQHESPTQCDSCSVTAYIAAPDTSLSVISLYDDGSSGDVTANDGIYSATYSPPDIPGTYYAEYVFNERDSTGANLFQRTRLDQTFVKVGLGSISSITGSDDVDSDGDGLIDSVGVTIGMTGSHAGAGLLRCRMHDENSNVVYANAYVSVAPGAMSVRVPFPGTELFQATTGSQLTVDLVELWQSGGGIPVREDTLAASYALTSRSPAAYEHGKVRLGDVLAGAWRDINSNGLADSLEVTLACTVDTTGTYSYGALLADSSGLVRAADFGSTSLTAGGNQLNLRFSANCLGVLDGSQSYTVQSVTVARGIDSDFKSECFTSSPLARDSLEGQDSWALVADTLVTACPRDHVGNGANVRMKMPRVCSYTATDIWLRAGLVVLSASDPSVRVWYPGTLTDNAIYGSYAVGDTIRATGASLDSGLVYFALPTLSGCGLLALGPVADGVAVGSPLRVHVRSYDVNGLVVGAVDKFDQASMDSGTTCTDFDWNPGTSDGSTFASHRNSKHAAEGAVTEPTEGDTLAIGEVVPISWTRLYGDSARVGVFAVKSGATVTIQPDMPDTGSVAWLIPPGTTTGQYEIQVKRHAGLGQGTSGVIGTIYSNSDFQIVSQGNMARVIGMQDTVLACPGGDGDSLAMRLDLEGAYVAGSKSYIQIDSLESGVGLWKEAGTQLAVGDTVNELARIGLPNGHLAARLAIARLSGCGRVTLSAYTGSGLVIHGIQAFVRSYDVNASAFGSVDRLDRAHWQSHATCDTCYACGDFNGDGIATADSDLVRLDAHLGHHVPRVFLWPTAGKTYSLGDTVQIGWRGGVGDSAFVTIRAVRGVSTDTTLIVANLAPASSYTWTVPSTFRAAGNYNIQVLHTAGRYQADYRNLGIAETDTTIKVRPIRVADATTTRGKHSWTLTWHEPGQNGGIEADAYDVRSSGVSRITEDNFSSMTVKLADGPPGPAETAHCTESDSSMLTPHKYYFAIRTRVGTVWSRMSDLDSASTGGPNTEVFCEVGNLLAGGGGDGGGESMRSGSVATHRRSSGVASLSSDDAEPAENSLLGWAGDVYASDTYKLPPASVVSEGGYAVRLRQLGQRPAELDRVGLGYVDHLGETESYVAGSNVLLGQSASVPAAWTSSPTQFMFASVDTPLAGERGTALTVALSGSGLGRALILAARSPETQAGGDSSGILVEVPSGETSWEPIGFVHPRRAIDDFAVALPSLTGAQARLVFYGDYEISGLRQLAVEDQTIPTPLTLAEAIHSRLGDVQSAESAEGGATTSLEFGDTLSLSYSTTSLMEGITREFFLTARGRYTAGSLPDSTGSNSSAIVVSPAWQFSLSSARPNPSSKDFAIDYTLARQMPVSIRVYDVAGRLVRTLVNENLAAGPHSVVWDGRNQDGRRVASSVYFYRMVAGSFTSERKAVLLTR
jgi:hypothetical protein